MDSLKAQKTIQALKKKGFKEIRTGGKDHIHLEYQHGDKLTLHTKCLAIIFKTLILH